MNKEKQIIRYFSNILYGAVLCIGITQVSKGYAETPSAGTPHIFGNCVVATTTERLSGLALFCGISEGLMKKNINIDALYDQKTKTAAPVLTFRDSDVKDKVDGKFVYGNNCSNTATVDSTGVVWYIKEPDLSRWDSIYRCLMSSPALAVEGPFGSQTLDITGLGQAFEYFTEQYKAIHHQPFPGWH